MLELFTNWDEGFASLEGEGRGGGLLEWCLKKNVNWMTDFD